jgi:hypothetical protein
MATTQAHTVAGGPGGEGGGPGRGRRTAIIAGVAGACAVAIAAPFALRGGGGLPPTPVAPPPRSAPPLPSGALTGDVDGDGTSDVVRLSGGGQLRIDLGSGRTVRRLLSHNPVLVGLARVDERGLVIVTSTRASDGTVGREWAVRRVTGGHLLQIPFAHRALVGSQPGVATAWIGADLALHDGGLDPLQHGGDHIAVLARTWTLREGRITSTPGGVSCWDRSGSAAPGPCPAGQDWRYDVGPHGDLPALLPGSAGRQAGSAGVTTDDGFTWTLQPANPPGPAESARVDLVVDGHGTTQAVAVPPGWAPGMFIRPARVGDLTDGVLLGQEGGDSDTWRVYVRWAGRVQQLETRGPVALGGGFTRSGGTAYFSWMSADGRLYTRIGTPRPGHYRVYAWVPNGATASTAPVLEAQDLGIVCLDETWGTYGTCAG